MAQQIGTSALLRTWANDGTVVVPADAKIDEGWLRGEQPPHEWMNYIHNILGQKINHALSRGAPNWNSGTEFGAGAIVNHEVDLWMALVPNSDSEPSEANSDWARIVDQSKDATINQVSVGLGGNSDIESVVLGRFALENAESGSIRNVAIGSATLRDTTTGRDNTGIGRGVLRISTTGEKNTAIGRDAAQNLTIGDGNVALGEQALLNLTTGDNNIGVGKDAGRTISPFHVTTEDNRIVMGNNDHTDAYINVAWTVTSDARDKGQIAPIEPGLEFIEALNPVSYQMKAGGRDGVADGRVRYGFLAQDILELEGENPVIVDAETPEKLKLHESHIIPVLVKAVQELSARVAELEGK